MRVYVCVCVFEGGRRAGASARTETLISTGSSEEIGTFVLASTNMSLKQHGVRQGRHVRYHVYRAAVYYACQSQYVYTTALWLGSLIPQFRERSLEGPPANT